MKDLVAYGAAFARAVSRFGPNPLVVLCQDEADGIAAGAILSRAPERAGYGPVDVHVIRQRRLGLGGAGVPEPGCIVVTDLGVQAGDIVPGLPMVMIDHHVPRFLPGSAGTTIISGHENLPIPTFSLLAHACAAALSELSFGREVQAA